MNKLMKILVWVLFIITTTTWCFDLINLPSTIANCIGIVLLFVVVYISIKTKCFTIIKLTKNKKENEENNF